MMEHIQPDLIHELSKHTQSNSDTERLLGVITALAGEVYVLKAQVQRLSQALEMSGVLEKTHLQNAEQSQEMKQWLSQEEKTFGQTILQPFITPDVSINATPWMREEQ